MSTETVTKNVDYSHQFSKEEALGFYRTMFGLRSFDLHCQKLKYKDLIMNGFHPYEGQEAVATGICSVLRLEDSVHSTHRPHGHSLCKGSSFQGIFGEMLARINGVSEGLGGPMQWCDIDNNFYCGSIVGSNVPMTCGSAYSHLYKKTDNISVSFFGDGASNTGACHEGLNLASIWKLPVLFVCENNQYGEAMPVRDFVSACPISKRAEGYSMEGVTIDGMNVFEVAATAQRLVEKIRKGEGPKYLETITYRYKGHYLGDPLNYRTKEEVDQWRERDPLEHCKKVLLEQFGASEAEIKAIEDEVENQVQADETYALDQRKLTLEESVQHVTFPLQDHGEYKPEPQDDTRMLTYAEAICEALSEEIERDPSVFFIGEDIGVWGSLFGCSRGLLDKYGPERVKDAPISEAGFTGMGVGAAMSGMRPVVEVMYVDFMSLALDQILNHAVKYPQMGRGRMKVPLVIRTQGGVGLRSSSQHSQSLENWFVNIPGLITIMPANAYDIKGLLKSAIRDDNPVMIIEHKAVYRDKAHVPEEEYLIPIGKAAVKRQGKDITIVATSWMSVHALEAAAQLAETGIDCEVIDPLTLYPLDTDTIVKSVHKTKHCVVVNEAPAAGGYASELAAVISENCWEDLIKPVKRVTGMRTGIPYDKDMELAVVPSTPWIVEAVKDVLE
jgi:pyruvate/2-oxoglutarate/acetoin dehydrogenase E1 component/TPP-dependent pyruvate/acetoin dehydrogenase alpha subunit